MYSKRFDKETFKKDVKNNVRILYRREIEEATPQQIFQAVSYAVKEAIIDDWLATQKTYDKEDPKTVYYMSMEFLMGRALGNNLINMTAYKDVKEALDENRSQNQALEMAVLEDWQRAFWILWQHLDMRLMAAESVIITECLSRKLRTVIRWKRLITG